MPVNASGPVIYQVVFPITHYAVCLFKLSLLTLFLDAHRILSPILSPFRLYGNASTTFEFELPTLMLTEMG
jgi:hypothetical protein